MDISVRSSFKNVYMRFYGSFPNNPLFQVHLKPADSLLFRIRGATAVSRIYYPLWNFSTIFGCKLLLHTFKEVKNGIAQTTNFKGPVTLIIGAIKTQRHLR